MNLSEIETFLMIVKTKNITKTAENLFLSQPTVSHRLKSLEDELGLQLISRKKGYKFIELTPQGEEFVPLAERWIGLWKEVQLLKERKERLFLSIGCTDTLSNTIMAPFYQRILEENKGLDLRIKTHQSEEIYGLLEHHEIDLGFVYHHLHFKNTIAEPILSEKMYIVQPADTKLKKPLIFLSELDPQKELFFSWEAGFQIWHDQYVENTTRPHMQIDSFGLILNMLRTKGAWIIAPASVVKMLLDYMPVQVSTIADENQPPPRITYKVRHKTPNRMLRKAMEQFEEELDIYLREMHWDIYLPMQDAAAEE